MKNHKMSTQIGELVITTYLFPGGEVMQTWTFRGVEMMSRTWDGPSDLSGAEARAIRLHEAAVKSIPESGI